MKPLFKKVILSFAVNMVLLLAQMPIDRLKDIPSMLCNTSSEGSEIYVYSLEVVGMMNFFDSETVCWKCLFYFFLD